MIIPAGISVTDWCDFMTLDLSRFGPIPTLDNPLNWGKWASSVITLPRIASLQPPVPSDFVKWDDWAFRFLQTLNRANLI